jgi:hypothetical protein
MKSASGKVNYLGVKHNDAGFALATEYSMVTNHNKDRKPAMLITIRPGPVLHVWKDGSEIAQVELTLQSAITVCREILREVV